MGIKPRVDAPARQARLALFPAIFTAMWLACGSTAFAQIGSDRYSSIVVDARTGRELSSINADEPRHPASLTKMMTLYMVFEAMRDRRLTLDTFVPVSPHSASMSPSKLGLVPGTLLTVEQAILGLVTKSANDAAAALGELLGGDETNFGQMMTIRARSLGMTRTVFRNASGLPDPEQISTARDMATLGRRLIADFPTEYRFFSTPSFRFHNKVIQNHDHLLQTYPGADGIKTGFITASGFNLVTSAVRSDVRLVGVVMGASRAIERDLHMAVLLNQGFEQLDIPAPTMTARVETPRRSLMPQAGAALPLPPPPPHTLQSRWAIQLGTFTSEANARQAAANARRLTDAGQIRVDSISVQGRQSWRAQVVGLSSAEASGACNALTKRKLVCTPVKSDNGQLARN
jgi:D-alanyl-D-alanine carboxypeptidase